MRSALLHRRRRRASSAATSPTACSPTSDASGSRSTTTSRSGPRVALRAARGDDRARGRPRRRQATSTRSTAAMAGHDLVIHLASNPDIARGDDRPERSTSTRARCSPTTSSRRCAATGVPHDRSTRRAAASTATSASIEARRGPRPARPGLDLRRQQARRRGADLVLRLHVRPAAAARSASATSSAARQTHGVGFDFVRRLRRRPDAAARSSATARRASPTSTSPTSSRAVLRRVDAAATEPFARLQRRDRRLHHGARDRRPGASSASASTPRDVALRVTAATAAGRATCPIVRLATDRIRALGWAPTARLARGAPRSRCWRCSPTLRAGRLRARARRPSSSTATACSTARSCRRRAARTRPRRSTSSSSCPGVARGVRARSRAAGLLLIVVTNQPDIARGTPDARRPSTRINEHACEAARGSTRSSSARTTTPTIARAASRSRGCSLDAAERLRTSTSPRSVHGRRSLARRRGRAGAAGCRTVFIDRGLRRARARGARR